MIKHLIHVFLPLNLRYCTIFLIFFSVYFIRYTVQEENRAITFCIALLKASLKRHSECHRTAKCLLSNGIILFLPFLPHALTRGRLKKYSATNKSNVPDNNVYFLEPPKRY